MFAKFLKAAAAAALLASGALGLFAAPQAALADDRPDLIVAVNALPRSLESAEFMGNVDVRVTYNLFDSLIRRDFRADGSGTASKLVPGLAESWTRIDDRTLEFKLRQGVKFHNGDELTAEDVVFSFSRGRLTGPKAILPEGPRFWSTLDRVEAVDPYTVRFIGKVPDVLLEQRLAGYASWIVNAKDYLTKGKDAYAWNPVGTGPYKFVDWKDGDYVKLEAFDDYFGGKPTAKTVTYKVVPELSARIAGLVSGEYDIIVNVPPDQVATLDSYDGVEARSIVLDNSHMLVYNTNNPALDKPLREAMNLAIDRALLRKALWLDKNYTPKGHQLASYTMYDDTRPALSYDVEKAKALVKQSSYNGEELTYRLIPEYYLNGLPAAQAIQQMWKEIGVNVKLEPVENWGQVRAGGWDIYPWSNTHRLPDPVGSFVPQWGPLSGIQKNKLIAWKAPAEYNKLNAVIEGSADWSERKAAYKQALDLWESEAPGTLLYNPLETYGVKSDIDWLPYALYYMDFRPDNLTFK
ncbi:MAG: ABC transporter substrate-binding protein [Kiloniellaceae bacterium]